MDDQARKKTLLAFFFIILVDNISFSLTFTLFPPIFLDAGYGLITKTMSAGLKNFFLGLSFLSFPLAQFFGAPILGDIADILGRRKALMISVFGVSIGVVVSALALSFQSISLLVFSRLFTGFFSGNLSICLAGISDLSETEKIRGKNFGYVASLMGAAWIFAMILGGFFSSEKLFSHFGPMIAFWVIAVISFVNLLIVYLYVDETFVNRGEQKITFLGGINNVMSALKIKSVRYYFLVYFFWTCGWGGAIQWFSSYSLQEFGVKPYIVAIAYVINGASWSLGGSIINAKLLNLFSSFTLTWISYLVIAPCVFSMGLIDNFYWFCLPVTLGAIFAAISMTNTLNLISLNASEAIQGKIMGLSQSVQALGFIFTLTLATILFTFSPASYFITIGVFLFLALLVLLAIHRNNVIEKKAEH